MSDLKNVSLEIVLEKVEELEKIIRGLMLISDRELTEKEKEIGKKIGDSIIFKSGGLDSNKIFDGISNKVSNKVSNTVSNKVYVNAPPPFPKGDCGSSKVYDEWKMAIYRAL